MLIKFLFAFLLLVAGGSAQAACTIPNYSADHTISSDCSGGLTLSQDFAHTLTIDANVTDSYYPIPMYSYYIKDIVINSGNTVTATSGYSFRFSNGSSNSANFNSLTNNGTISDRGYAIKFDNSQGSGDTTLETLTNNGSIESRFAAILLNTPDTSINNLINTGTISTSSGHAPVYLTDSGASVTNFTNTGTLAGNSGSGIDFNNSSGTVTNFSNKQGKSTTNPLRYSGALPANTKIIIGSSSDYGQISFSSISGTTAFHIDTTNSASKASINDTVYSSVLIDIPSANIPTKSGISGTVGWVLTDSDNNNTWDLEVSDDTTSPTMAITSAEVSDGASSNDSTLAMTFTSSEATSNFVVGDISVSGGALSSFNATSSTVYTATFTPSGDGAKTIDVNANVFTDSSSNNNSAATQFNWTYDATSPTLSSSTPTDGATGVAVDANIVLTFSEAVDVESGNIVIKKSSDDSTVETIAVTDSKITGTGTTTITINPSSTLIGLTSYYVTITATAFDDSSSNSYAGITDATTLNFTTVATNLPSPLDKKDVIGSIEAWSDISSSWANSNIKSAQGRIDWLNRHKGSNQTSYQGIQINFADTLINKIMNSTPGAALRDIDAVDTTASLIGGSNATLDEVGDNAEVKATDIAINEATRLREGLIGSLNPSFGPVTGNWSVWTEGEVIIGKTDASTAASKKKSSAQAITLGFDRPIRSGNELIGFVISAGQSDTDIGTASTSVKSNNYSLLNYSVFNTKGAELESVFGIGQLDFDTTRTDGSDALTGTRKANQLLFSSTIRPQRTINLGNWHLSPYTKISLANTRLNSFSESGGATALTFNKQEIKDGALGVGFDISTLIKNRGNTIQPFAKIEYARSSSKTSASMHYNDEDASLYTYTTSLNKNDKNWTMKLGFDLNTKSNWDMSLVYIREQSKSSSDGSKSSSNGLIFNASIKF